MEVDQKVCPRCAETIKAAAVVCRYCKHEFGPLPEPTKEAATVTTSPPSVQRKKDAKGCVVVIIALVAFIVIGKIMSSPGTVESPASSSGNERPSVTSSDTPASTPIPQAPLKVISWSCQSTASDHYFETTGQVENVSGEPIKNVSVVAQYFSSDGTFIKSDDALIEFNPIMPGQVSPFKSLSTSNPLIKKCSISFKQLMGGALEATMPEAKHK